MAKEFSGVNLDGNLDDIDDLPSFAVWPTGAYHIKLVDGLVQKEIGGHKAVEMNMTLVAIMELATTVAEEDKPKVGDTCNSAFMLDNAIGAGKFKEVLKPLGEKLGTKVPSAIMSGCKGMDLVVTIAKTHDKDKDRDYCNIKALAVL